MEQNFPRAARDPFVGPVTLPTVPFRVVATGVDGSNFQYQREFSAIHRGQAVKVEVAGETVATVLAGETTTFSFTVTNLGDQAMYGIEVVDNLGFVARVDPEVLSLEVGASGTVEVDISVPDATPDGTSVAVTATATRTDASTVFNSATLNLITTNIPPELSNISTRGRVETGDNVMIGGFIIGGTEPKTVLIRARGPALADFGVPEVLANPFLQLFSGQTVIAQNDNWQATDPLCGSPAVSCGGETEIIATALDPCQPIELPGQPPTPTGCNLEPAILVTLDPGNYTAIVSGVGGGTGVGLVEVFEVN